MTFNHSTNELRVNILRFVRWFCLLGVVAALQTPCAEACKYTVRDVAFVTLREEPYRLLVYADQPTSLEEQSVADAASKLRSAALAALADSNIVVEWIPGDPLPDSIAARTADQLGLPGGPAIALVGPDDRAIRLPLSDAQSIDVDLIRDIENPELNQRTAGADRFGVEKQTLIFDNPANAQKMRSRGRNFGRLMDCLQTASC